MRSALTEIVPIPNKHLIGFVCSILGLCFLELSFWGLFSVIISDIPSEVFPFIENISTFVVGLLFLAVVVIRLLFQVFHA